VAAPRPGGLKRIGMTPDAFHASYSVPLRFRPVRLRAI